MDFGHVSYKTLEAIDFTLPPEPAPNRSVLPGHRARDPKVYIGCPRWSVKEWVGKLYPKGTKEARFLDEYSKQFTCIELNSTFYTLYNETALAKWVEKVGDTGFRFCPKVYQGISHEGNLHDKQALTHVFEKSVKAFGSHLGTAFLQLGDRFGPQRQKELATYLQTVPPSLPLFVELRHPDWFGPAQLEELAHLLQTTGHGFIITDTAGRRDVCHMHLTQSWAMIRFVANNLHPTDYTRLRQWVERIRYWIENGLEELYFILHMEGEKHAPELAGYLVDQLNAACGLQLKKPVLLQQELF